MKDEFAIIEALGHQYMVSVGDKIKMDKIEGKTVTFDQVLVYGKGKTDLKIGRPTIEGAKVEAKVLETKKDKKIIIFKYKPKTRYKKKSGHRQTMSEVEITKISV